MTDTNHIEQLRAIRFMLTDDNERQAIDAAITALSARASAGEGGITPDWVIGYFPSDVSEEVKQTVRDAFEEHAAIYPTPAPQPAQAGASGGGEPVGEFQDWFEAWAKEKEEIILHRIADGRLISPTASIAESAFLAGCMTASMYYMELCRNDSTAATQPSEAHTCDFMDGLDDCPACKFGQATCGYHTRNPTTPPAHGDGEGDDLAMHVKLRDLLSGKSLYVMGREHFDQRYKPLYEIVFGMAMADKILFSAKDADYIDTRPTPEARDAARYRWLRERWGRISETYMGESSQMDSIGDDEDGWEVDPTSLDDSIDAALALPAQGEGS